MGDDVTIVALYCHNRALTSDQPCMPLQLHAPRRTGRKAETSEAEAKGACASAHALWARKNEKSYLFVVGGGYTGELEVSSVAVEGC